MPNPVCVNTHSATSLVQGPGMCCAALAASGQAPHIGLRIAARDKRGKCVVCEIAASTAKNAAPGQMKFKRGKSAGLCPTSRHGCCALLTAA